MDGEPRTAAGQRLLDWFGGPMRPGEKHNLQSAILAIEAEASAEPGALRAALERTADLPEDAPPPGMKADWYAAGWGDRGDALCAALSATQDGTPAGVDVVRLAKALNASVGKNGWLRSTPSDPAIEWMVNAEIVAAEYARLSTSEPRREDS